MTATMRHYWVDPRRNETADPCDLCGHYGWREVPGCDCCDLTPAERRRRQREDARARRAQVRPVTAAQD